jgi:superfamily II DNA or RNA helicase
MTRTFVTDPSVQPLVAELAAAVAQYGSVNALFRQLRDILSGDTDGTIYPNRLHALLSDDSSRAINSQTLKALTSAAKSLPTSIDGGPETVARLRMEARAALEKATRESGWDPGSRNALTRVSEALSLPLAVVRFLLDAGPTAPKSLEQGAVSSDQKPAGRSGPDWSFHDDAYRSALSSLRSDPNRKTAIVIPTGGGKTRIGVRILLRILADDPRKESVVLWLTHRRYLAKQARRELQRVLTDGTPDLPENAVQLLHDRVHVVMIGDLELQLGKFKDQIALVVVDEGHHAAAESYRHLFEHRPLRLLSLTATPVRSDNAAIGVDEIAYSTTYRDLFDRGVLIEPHFEEPLSHRDWTDPEALRDFADYVLSRAREEFVKTIVVTPRVDHVLAIHEALTSELGRLLEGEGHILTDEDIGYVHGSASSTGADPTDFLDEFVAKPRGIVVATASMLGEGFDDPKVNAVIVTYPATSLLQLMQIAGRCLRYEPGKTNAYIVQTKESELAYHFEQRWLYQDISDVLRPQLIDSRYGSKQQLRTTVEAILKDHRVDETVQQAVLSQVDRTNVGDSFSLLLSGFPFSGSPDRFLRDAEWNAVPITPDDRDLFIRIFNDFSARALEVKFPTDFLRNYLTPDSARASQWMLIRDMLHAMERAASEIHGHSYFGADARGYSPALGTTWLRYCTFTYAPLIPASLVEFLGDALNREHISAQFSSNSMSWAACIKLPHPLGGQIAYLLDHPQNQWFEEERGAVTSALQGAAVDVAFVRLDAWFSNLTSCPVPLHVARRIEHFVSANQSSERIWLNSSSGRIADLESDSL